jgi:hypothetical protein
MKEMRSNIDSNENFVSLDVSAWILKCGNGKLWKKKVSGQMYKTAGLCLYVTRDVKHI